MFDAVRETRGLKVRSAVTCRSSRQQRRHDEAYCEELEVIPHSRLHAYHAGTATRDVDHQVESLLQHVLIDGPDVSDVTCYAGTVHDDQICSNFSMVICLSHAVIETSRRVHKIIQELGAKRVHIR